VQVDQLNAQVAQLAAAAEDKTKLEAALKSSDKARLEAEEVVRQLRRHNSDTQRDVAKLQQELAGLALKQAKSGANASHELDTAMAMVRGAPCADAEGPLGLSHLPIRCRV
jgi:phage shock protein A